MRLQDLQQRHQKDLEVNREDLEARLALEFKFSKELLKLQVMQNGLAK